MCSLSVCRMFVSTYAHIPEYIVWPEKVAECLPQSLSTLLPSKVAVLATLAH